MQSLPNRRNSYYQGCRNSMRQKRVIHKLGDLNVMTKKGKKPRRFYHDLYNTVIDAQWRYVFILFALSYFGTWFGFAVLWYLIAYAHGDFSIDPETGLLMSDGPRPCLEGVKTFIGCILMSIETQTSIGFGLRYPGELCPEAVFLMAAQLVVAYVVEGATIGIMYAKMVRPARRAFNMNFSRRAVICLRNAKLCLIFRLSDAAAIHIVNTTVKAVWLEQHLSSNKQSQPNERNLKLENDGNVFLIFPMTVCHVINENSPLYTISQAALVYERFEIVVTLTGSSRTTGQVTQSRTSYLPREIIWGHRFVDMNYYDELAEMYVADFDRMDDTESVDMPTASAQQLDEMQNDSVEFL